MKRLCWYLWLFSIGVYVVQYIPQYIEIEQTAGFRKIQIARETNNASSIGPIWVIVEKETYISNK